MIFKKLRRKFINKFLKSYVTEAQREELEQYTAEIIKRDNEISRLNAYINGLEYALKCGVKIKCIKGDD